MKKILFPVLLSTIFAIGLLVSGPEEAEASGRSCFSYSSSSYCYPTYQPTYIYRDVIREVPVAYPVPFTVAVPVVSYLYNGGGYTYAPVYQAQPAAGMGTVSTTPQAPTQQGTNGELQFTDAQVDNLINRIEQRLAAKAKNGTNGTNGHAKSTPPTAVPSDVYTILTLKRGTAQKSCMDCHTGSTAKGGQKIFLEPGKLNPDADWTTIWDVTDEGRMPPEAQKNRNAALSDQEVQVLRAKMLEGKNGKK